MTTTEEKKPPTDAPTEAETMLPGKHATLVEALAAFQAELPQINKTNTADMGNFSYDYADLADVSAAVLPVLGRHGLSFSARPTVGESGAFVLFYKLAHESGDTEDGIYPLPPATTSPQQLGSAITYARRYVLCAVTGVAPGGDDDDAALAPAAPQQRQQNRQQPARQKPVAPTKATKDWATEAAKITSLELLTALADEANSLGELGVKAGEGTVFDALTARKRELENPPLIDDAGTPGKERNWVGEVRGSTSRTAAQALIQEATAAGVSPARIEAMTVALGNLPDDTAAATEPVAGWAVAEIPKSAEWSEGGEPPAPEEVEIP